MSHFKNITYFCSGHVFYFENIACFCSIISLMWKKNNDYIEKKHSAIVTPPTSAKAAGNNNSKSRWQQQQKLFGSKRIMISLCGRQKDLAHCFVAPIVLLNLSWREYHCIPALAEHETILDDIVRTGGQWDQLCFSSNIFFEHQWTVMCHCIITANWWTIVYRWNTAYCCNLRLVRCYCTIYLI